MTRGDLIPALSVQFLGRFRVSVDGCTVDTHASRRTRNLLAYLLANGSRPLPRDVLMDVFWPDAEERAARNCLHVGLSGVRQALREATPHPVIERSFDCYQLADDLALWRDVDEFDRHAALGNAAWAAGDRAAATEAYEAACQLYEGDFLAEEPYLDWPATRREALRLEAVEVQRRLVDLYAGRGDHGPAIVLARRILAMDPCNEPVHRALIGCYAAVGQVHLALSQFRTAADELWSNFGARPSAETTELAERVRRGDPS